MDEIKEIAQNICNKKSMLSVFINPLPENHTPTRESIEAFSGGRYACLAFGGLPEVKYYFGTLTEELDRAKHQLKEARTAFNTQQANLSFPNPDIKPTGRHAEQIGKSLGLVQFLKLEIDSVQTFISRESPKVDKTKVYEGANRLSGINGKGPDGRKVLIELAGRAVIKTKKGVLVFKDDPQGETVLAYKNRIQKENIKMYAAKEQENLKKEKELAKV